MVLRLAKLSNLFLMRARTHLKSLNIVCSLEKRRIVSTFQMQMVVVTYSGFPYFIDISIPVFC